MADKEKIRHPEPELTRKKQIPVKEYGLLKVFEWPDGTIVHINTKKGEENMRIHHSSGGYDEYGSNGTKVSFSPNNTLQYAKGGVTITFDNNVDSKGAGHSRVSIDHDAHIEVKKNASIACAGTADIVGVGHVKVAATDLYLGSTKGSIVLNSAVDIELKAAGRIFTDSGRVTQITAKGDIHLETEADAVVVAKGEFKGSSQGNWKMKTQASFGALAQSWASVKSSGDSVYIDASSATLHAKASVTKVTPPWVTGAQASPDS